MIEELANRLAVLQVEMEAISDKMASDETIREYITGIAKTEKQLSKRKDELHDLISRYGQDQIDESMNEIKDQIINEWTGEKKTMVFDAGTLKFRTTKSMEIVDGGRLLEHIIENTSTDEAVNKYLKGFILTPTKAYVDVHELGEGIAKINSKTAVKLEQKSG